MDRYQLLSPAALPHSSALAEAVLLSRALVKARFFHGHGSSATELRPVGPEAVAEVASFVRFGAPDLPLHRVVTQYASDSILVSERSRVLTRTAQSPMMMEPCTNQHEKVLAIRQVSTIGGREGGHSSHSGKSPGLDWE